jgi:hypothetical protein
MGTGLFEEETVQKLIESEGDEGFRVWLQIRLAVVDGIDFRNDDNGELSVPGGLRSPIAFASFLTGKSEERLREIFDTCADLELIDRAGWQEDRIFFPELMERASVQTFLKKQEGGSKGGSRSPSSSPSGSPPRDTDEDVDLNEDVEQEKPEPSGPDSFSMDQLREEYGDKAVEFTDYFIEQVDAVNGRRNTPDKGTELYMKWVKAFDRLNRIGPQGGTEGEDGYSWDELSEILQYAFSHEGKNFSWKNQVRSPIQLRQSPKNDDAKIVKIEDSMPDQPEDDFYAKYEEVLEKQ